MNILLALLACAHGCPGPAIGSFAIANSANIRKLPTRRVGTENESFIMAYIGQFFYSWKRGKFQWQKLYGPLTGPEKTTVSLYRFERAQ